MRRTVRPDPDLQGLELGSQPDPYLQGLERVAGTRRTQIAGAPDPLAAAARTTTAEVVERRGRRPDGVGRLWSGSGRGGGLAAGGRLLGLRGHLDDGESVFSSRKVGGRVLSRKLGLVRVRRGTKISTMITRTPAAITTTPTTIATISALIDEASMPKVGFGRPWGRRKVLGGLGDISGGVKMQQIGLVILVTYRKGLLEESWCRRTMAGQVRKRCR